MTESRVARSEQDGMKTMALAVWALYLLSLLLGFTGIVGIIIAHMKRGEAAGTIWEGHFTFAIRTFWVGLLVSLVSIPLMVILIGWPLLIAVSLWFIVRSVIGLLKALDQKPIENPQSWLI